MSAYIWILIGLIGTALSAWAITHGYNLKNRTVQIESLEDNDSLSYEDEIAYKGIVAQILNEFEPNSRVIINDKIIGFNSKKMQKVDISIYSKIDDQEILTVFYTHAGTKPINILEVNDFYHVLNDIRASKGIIISNAEFTSPVKNIAPSYGIELYSIIDAQSTKWNDDIKIPVLYIKLKVNFNLQGEVYLEIDDSIPKNSNLWNISFDGGKTSQRAIEYFKSMWDTKKISHVPELYHTFEIDRNNLFLLVNKNKWTKVDNPLLTYKIEQEGFLHYFKPEEYRALKNHLTGNIEPSSLLMKFNFLKDNINTVKINDIDNFKKRTKGILFVIEDRIDKLDNATPGKTSIKLIEREISKN